jgi:HlyD family secretion protein
VYAARVIGDRRTLVTSLLAAALCAACGRGEPATASATARVERGRLERIVVATGTIEAENEVEVRSRIPGIVETIHVKANQAVAEDQPLFELEKDLLLAQVAEARAGVRAAEVEERYARIALERASQLERRDATSERALDDARSRAETAAAAIARARAVLESLEVQLRYATIRAPRAGVVLDVAVEEGSAISAVTSVTGGTLLLTLADTNALHLEGLVDENEVARLALGQPARVRTEAFADRAFAGRVREISPLGKRVQNVTYFEVEVAIDDAGAALLRPRMSGDADIVTEVAEGVLSVPDTALRYGPEGVHVLRVDGTDGAAPATRAVQIGIVDGARVEIREGLAEGDAVVLQ